MADLTIWKFDISVADEFYVLMPVGAEILHVDVQDGQPCMWALVDPAAIQMSRKFFVHGTGHWVAGSKRYVGSFMLLDGRFVGHLFEPALIEDPA